MKAILVVYAALLASGCASVPFTPLEAKCPAACRGDECRVALANAGFNAPRELLTGFTQDEERNIPLVVRELARFNFQFPRSMSQPQSIEFLERSREIFLDDPETPERPDVKLVFSEDLTFDHAVGVEMGRYPDLERSLAPFAFYRVSLMSVTSNAGTPIPQFMIMCIAAEGPVRSFGLFYDRESGEIAVICFQDKDDVISAYAPRSGTLVSGDEPRERSR